MLFAKVWQMVRNAVQLWTPTKKPEKETQKAQKPTEGKTAEVSTRQYYNEASDPQVTFKVFRMRVEDFGWSREEALKDKGHSDNVPTAFFKGSQYTLKEIYEACRSAAVSYNTFYTRVIARGWSVEKALQTQAR